MHKDDMTLNADGISMQSKKSTREMSPATILSKVSGLYIFDNPCTMYGILHRSC